MRDDERPDDDVMDGLLREALGGDPPALSPAFDQRVLEAVRPRRLSTGGRLALGVYAVASIGAAALLMREIPAPTIALAIGTCAAIAAAASAYARRLVSRA